MSVDDLTEQQVSEFREAFKLFDRDGDGQIPVSEVGTVLRAINQNPSESDIAEIVREVQAQNKTGVDFVEFLTFVSRQMKTAITEDDLKDAFKVLDKQGTGLISAQDLKHYVTTIGEPMSKEEADQLLDDVQVDANGMINYNAFVSFLLAK